MICVYLKATEENVADAKIEMTVIYEFVHFLSS